MSETWVIRDNAPVDEASRVLPKINVSFTTDNGLEFGEAIEVVTEGSICSLLYYVIYFGIKDTITAADVDFSAETAFVFGLETRKTLVFDTAPTGALLAWLTKNAEKQTVQHENFYTRQGVNEMIHFTDKRLYLKGIGEAMCTNRKTGDVLYWSNKFQTGNVTPNVDNGEIRAGLGNSLATMIPSNAGVTVEMNAADFSLWAKAAQTGATLSYNATVMTCTIVTATGTSLSINKAEGTPVAQKGFSKIFCYVQEVGAPSEVATGGVAYALNPDTGAISGFTAESGKKYKVFYFVNKANAQIAAMTTAMDPAVVHFTATFAVFCNEAGNAQNEGTRTGTLFVIVPALKFGANGSINGDQTNNDTTSISGQAVSYDSDIITDSCDECASAGSDLCYYIYQPCGNTADDVEGIVANIGSISVAKSGTYQMQPRIVMTNGELVKGDTAVFTYTAKGAPSGTTVSTTGLITAGDTAGDFTVEVGYTAGEQTFKDSCDVSVTA